MLFSVGIGRSVPVIQLLFISKKSDCVKLEGTRLFCKSCIYKRLRMLLCLVCKFITWTDKGLPSFYSRLSNYHFGELVEVH